MNGEAVGDKLDGDGKEALPKEDGRMDGWEEKEERVEGEEEGDEMGEAEKEEEIAAVEEEDKEEGRGGCEVEGNDGDE